MPTMPPHRHVALIDAGAHLTSASPINGDAIDTRGRKGLLLWLDIVTDPDTVAIVVKLQAYDETAAAWIDIPSAALASKASVGHFMLTLYPGIAETANVSLSDILPAKIRAVSTHSGGTTMTYSVQADLIA